MEYDNFIEIECIYLKKLIGTGYSQAHHNSHPSGGRDRFKVKVKLAYNVSFITIRATQKNSVSNKQNVYWKFKGEP